MELGLIVGLVASVILLVYLVSVVVKKNKQLKKFSGILSVEDEIAKQNKVCIKLHDKAVKMTTDINEANSTLLKLEDFVKIFEDKIGMIEVASYDPIFDYTDSDTFKQKIFENKDRQKLLIKNKLACNIGIEWVVEGSKAKGKAMSNEAVKLALRSFNNECDALIGKVRWNNVDAFKTRMSKAHETINKLNSRQKLTITTPYLLLKYDELTLNYEKALMIQEEKERAKELADQLREEEKAVREFENAIKNAEKQEEEFAKALKIAKAEAARESGAKLNSLEAKIAALQSKLDEASSNKERALSQAQLTRSGFVYVLSNIGSFGEGKYKIGMTRRLNPNDRVKELSGAGVPFVFDTHAMIFTDDAPGLENKLHKYFQDKRVNKVNNRKEFFKVSLNDIKEAVKNLGVEAEFIMNHEAEQFRLS